MIKDMLEISYEVICCSFKAILLAILIFTFPLWIIPYAIAKKFKNKRR
jgi:hypothetical protein